MNILAVILACRLTLLNHTAARSYHDHDLDILILVAVAVHPEVVVAVAVAHWHAVAVAVAYEPAVAYQSMVAHQLADAVADFVAALAVAALGLVVDC